MDCRVALAQIDPTLGNLHANLDLHLAQADEAAARGADMLLFPEMSLTGYFLKDQVADVARSLGEANEIEELAKRSKDLSLGVGFVERDRDGRLYNAYAFLEDGEIKSVHRKVHLVTYGMFEESRDIAPGDAFVPFDSKHGRVGVLVCEDMWHISSGYIHFLNGVDALLIPSASPGRGVTETDGEMRSARVWNTMLEAASLWFQTWVVYVNRVGVEDGITFGGGSRVIDPDGRTPAKLDILEVGMADARMTSEALQRARLATPLRRDEKPWLVSRAIMTAESRSAIEVLKREAQRKPEPQS